MAIETKDWVAAALTVWANTIATIALVVSIRQSKTAPGKPHKRKRKR